MKPRPREARKAESREYREYRLGDAPLADELRRVVRGRVDHATGLLRGSGNLAKAVHESRKDMKKARSALRLVRSSLGEEAYRRENEHYRDISRGLSRFRDAEAMLECLDELEDWAGETGRFAGLRARLLEENRAGLRDGSMRRAASVAAGALEAGRGRIANLNLPEDPVAAELCVEAGLDRAWRRGRKRLARLEEDSGDERWHDWRKRAKDLWYQQALVDRDAALVERAHEISSLLGDDHDLAILRGVVEEKADTFSWPGEKDHITDLIVRRRDQLEGEALSLGRPLYS